MLQVTGLSKEYGKKNDRFLAVDDLSFTVGKGELVGFLGPNGAGNTTTVKMLCGLIVPDKGKIEIGGFDPWHDRKKALKNISAVLECNRNIYWPLTVRENMEFFAALHGISSRGISERIDELVGILGLKHKINEYARNLSRGMQQKLALGVALNNFEGKIVTDEKEVLPQNLKHLYNTIDKL